MLFPDLGRKWRWGSHDFVQSVGPRADRAGWDTVEIHEAFHSREGGGSKELFRSS